jgi:hypothetical protein
MKKKDRTRLLRLISAQRDMTYALGAYESFKKATDNDERYHFLLSMVISYGRPFTENHGIGNLEVDNRTFPDYDDPQMNTRHHRLLEIRHRFLAHSSADGTALAVVPPGVVNPNTGTAIANWGFNVGKREFLRPEFAAWLVDIIADLHKRLLVDINRLLPLCSPAEVTFFDTDGSFSWERGKAVGRAMAPPEDRSWFSRLVRWACRQFGGHDAP